MPTPSFSPKSPAALALLLAVGLFAGVAGARAQDTANPSQAPAAAPIVVTGCLQSSGQRAFTLTDSSTGTTYDLASESVDLSAHVGHTVKLTGTVAAPSADADADADANNASGNPANQEGQKNQTLNVSRLKMVSKTCSGQI
jgi:hypothetical protein